MVILQLGKEMHCRISQVRLSYLTIHTGARSPRPLRPQSPTPSPEPPERETRRAMAREAAQLAARAKEMVAESRAQGVNLEEAEKVEAKMREMLNSFEVSGSISAASSDSFSDDSDTSQGSDDSA